MYTLTDKLFRKQKESYVQEKTPDSLKEPGVKLIHLHIAWQTMISPYYLF